MPKIINVLSLAAFCLVAGCGEEKGKDFIGHWQGQGSASRSSLDISHTEGSYHIDFSYPDPVIGKKLEVNKLEAVAESDTVLIVHAALGNVTLRLEGDTVSMEDKVFKKTQ